ncbi:hypothetical protein [Serratia liquefaciens]|uniref:hypothetical protein n=1 Tax=Serratia liquefaciens TaxID=614 RepID=UPI0010215B29|nr:hypothetical protein [Serratia liquefaciens]RYM73286.1 hypothetical protein BSQ99_04760 [Serratia liquefaciens]
MVDDFFKYRYGWEKFHGAVHSLCGHGDIKERLENAYIFNISHIRSQDNLPEPLHEKFNELVTSLTNVQPEGDEGQVRATIKKMDELKINKAIEDIIGLYDDICRFMPNLHA